MSKQFPLMALFDHLQTKKAADPPAQQPIVVNLDLSGLGAVFAKQLGNTELKLKHGQTVVPS